jgi:hypothetical protein
MDLCICGEEDINALCAAKRDYIIGLIETMADTEDDLSSGNMEFYWTTKSILNEKLKELYQPYLNHLSNRNLGIDRNVCPTMKDLHDVLVQDGGAVALAVADIMRPWCADDNAVFAHTTNFDTTGRLVIYDVGEGCSKHSAILFHAFVGEVWTRIQINAAMKKRSWAYFDYDQFFHLHIKTISFFYYTWVRARTYYSTFTVLCNSFEEIYKTPIFLQIFSGVSFLQVLHIKEIEVDELSYMLDLSKEEKQYISQAPLGGGLLVTGNERQPFAYMLSESEDMAG